MDVERRFGLRIISGFGMSETTFGMIEDVHGVPETRLDREAAPAP